MSKVPRDLDTIARMLATRFDRRRLVKGAGGIAAGAAAAQLVAGTAGAAGRPTSSASERYQQAVKKGGTLVSMLVAEPTSMDIAAGSGQHNYALMSNVFENLLQYDVTTFDAKPCLAESYEVSPDGLTYTFHLRKSVLFHDGTPMNADAVKFSYVRIMDPTNPYYKMGQPFPLIDFWYEAIDPHTIVVKDEYTVVFNLKEQFATLPSFLAWPAAGIVSPTALQKYGKNFRTNPVGTGPFKFKQWIPNQKVEFTRFDQYWGGPAALDGLVVRPIIEEQTRVTELEAGNIDFAYDLPPDNVPQIKSSPKYHFYEAPLGHVWFLVLNTKSGPTANVKVRQAIAYAERV